MEPALNDAAFAALLEETIARDASPTGIDDACFDALFAEEDEDPGVLTPNMEELFAIFDDDDAPEDEVDAAYDAMERELERELAAMDEAEEEQDEQEGEETTAPRNRETTDHRQYAGRRPIAASRRRSRAPPAPIVYDDLDFSDLYSRGDHLRPHPPVPEKEFDSFELCTSFYRQWARENGILFVRTYWIKDVTRARYKARVRCSRGRDRKEIDDDDRVRMESASWKTRCPFEFYIVALDRDDPMAGRWRILHQKGKKKTLKSLLHNHPPMKSIYANAQYRREEFSTAEVRQKVAELFEDCRGSKATLHQLRSLFPGIKLRRQDVRNMWGRWQRDGLEFCVKTKKLVHRLREKSYFFEHVEDAENRIKLLVIIHPRCLERFKASPDALLLDVTHKTNKYNLPLLNMVGSDGENVTRHLGVALMAKTEQADFEWVLEQVKVAVKVAIPLFVTDNDGACINAINSVFPAANITLCRWHMNKSVVAYGKTWCQQELGRKQDAQGRWHDTAESRAWMRLFWSAIRAKTLLEFEQKRALLHETSPIIAAYLDTNWFNRSDLLIDAITDKFTHFGLLVTSKVEGAHAVLKSWLAGSRADILSFFNRLDSFYEEQIANAELEEHVRDGRRTIRSQQPIFERVVHRLTRRALFLVAEQLALARKHLAREAIETGYTARCTNLRIDSMS
ncbi:hypothetical protein HBI81_252820 [Parastagonospora nodorum]|nr:hypothetical protein HBI64_238260 [Parastagonospora nodorum]KAH6510838.1 hypothetical protein HBI81_252820 [Parastagonospora nodorum]